MKNKKTFQTTLLIIFISSILIPLIIMSTILSSFIYNKNLNKIKNEAKNISFDASQNIETYLEDVKRLSLIPHLYPNIMEYYTFLNTEKHDTYINVTDAYNDYKLTQSYRIFMQKILTLSRNDIKGIVFIPLNNSKHIAYILDTYNSSIRETDSFHYTELPWYNECIQKKGSPILTNIHTVTYYGEGQPITVFSVVRLVRDINTGKSLGVIKVDASSETIQNIFNNIQLNGYSSFMLLDGSNNVIYSTNKNINGDFDNITLDSSKVTLNGKDYFMFTKYLDLYNWKLVYLSSDAGIISEVISIFYLIGIIVILYFIVSFLLFRSNTHKITDPVKNIIRTMKEVEKGNLNIHVNLDYNTNDEFSIISHELNYMIDKLNTHINNEYKAVISQKNAEYLALQTQINPHFLYNILNNFITLNRIGEKKLLENSIIHLTQLFRYTCSNGNTVTIKEEFEFLEKYLELQKLRFDERLSFKIQCSPSVEAKIIPKLLIQPLVENSVIHGMEPSEHPVFTEIYAAPIITSFLEAVMIIVYDNGIGFDLSTNKLKNRIGLTNIIERLTLFNPRSTFEIDSKPGFYTICTIIIPLQ